MKAARLIKTIENQRQAIGAVIAQLEEIQVAFNAQFDEFKAHHDSELDRLAELVTDRLPTASDQLRTAVERRLPIERKGIEERHRKVREEHLPRREQAAQNLLDLAQDEMGQLGTLNPQLDAREERLKREKSKLESQLQELNSLIRTKSRGLGGIWRFVSLTKADRERQRVLGKLEAVRDSLYQVRRIWSEQRTTAEARQAGYQEEWRAEMLAVARLQAELDQLNSERRRDALAFGRAVRFVLDELLAPVECEDPELTERLAKMAKLNVLTDAYHNGLSGAAGLIGLFRGIDSGMEAISKSAAGLQREQEMHSAHLKPLDFTLPAGVAEFHAQWPALAEQFADEKHLSTHPADFSRALRPLIDGWLSEPRIEAMFAELGAMMSHATKAWEG